MKTKAHGRADKSVSLRRFRIFSALFAQARFRRQCQLALDDATPAMKKRIIRTVVEEIVVNLDDETEKFTFTIHWKVVPTRSSG